MLVNSKILLRKARKRRYALGAFNVYNIETIKAVIGAAEKVKSPVILQTSASAINYAGLSILAETIKVASKCSKMPIVLHLDHAKNAQLIKKCINAGYSSIMFDGSDLPFLKNIAITKKITQLAHKRRVSVEAELGTIGGKEDFSSSIHYTNPKQAEIFIKKTKIDSLAIAIGTSHGAYKSQVKNLKFDILKEIKEKTKIPLVLHGASLIEKREINKAKNYGIKIKKSLGISKGDIKKAIKLGICKINVDTDLRIIFSSAMREFYSKNPSNINPRDALIYAEKEMEKSVIEHLNIFGSAGKA